MRCQNAHLFKYLLMFSVCHMKEQWNILLVSAWIKHTPSLPVLAYNSSDPFPNPTRFLIMYMHACVLGSIWLFVTPQTIACQAPPSMGFPRQEYCSGLPFSPPRDLPDLGIKPPSPASPALAGRFFTYWATWEAPQGTPINKTWW